MKESYGEREQGKDIRVKLKKKIRKRGRKKEMPTNERKLEEERTNL